VVILLILAYGFVLAVFFGSAVYLIAMIDSALGGLDFATSNLATRKIKSIIQMYGAEKAILYDLGSGRGGFAIATAKVLPKLRIRGIDNSWLRVLLSKIRAVFLGNIIFKKANIFNTDVSPADIIYLYLPQGTMPDLYVKLQKELKSGALVITSTVFFSSWEPVETFIIHPENPDFEKIFVYQKD
jgi:hypothetical protein